MYASSLVCRARPFLVLVYTRVWYKCQKGSSSIDYIQLCLARECDRQLLSLLVQVASQPFIRNFHRYKFHICTLERSHPPSIHKQCYSTFKYSWLLVSQQLIYWRKWLTRLTDPEGEEGCNTVLADIAKIQPDSNM